MTHLLQIHEPGQTPAPHANDCVIGIDLGTTHSVVATKKAGKIQLLETPDGSTLIPSAIAYIPRPVVGENALKFPNVIRSIKRLMGRAVNDLSKDIDGHLFDLIDQEKSQDIIRLHLDGQEKTAIDISADILKHLKSIAQLHLGDHSCKAVITVPAYFDDAARTATRDAAKLAGINVLRLINEPTAAALAYGLDKNVEGLYAIYDLGGGTFDFSLLNLRQGIFQVVATGGNTRLGGDDFDQVLAKHLIQLRVQDIAKETISSAQMKEILTLARSVKETLSSKESCGVTLNFHEKETSYTITQETLNTLIQPLVDQTMQVVESVLHDAKKAPTDIKGIVLVGGSTRIPKVVSAVQEFFQQDPLIDIHPDHAVAIGAAYQADALTNGSDTILLDVTPLSLGIETTGGLVEKIIDRNTPIPVHKAQEFTTSKDGQSAMKIHVVQGEREMVADCRSLGEFTLTNIPPMVAGAPRIQIAFSLDANGLLTVSAKEKTTGQKADIEIKPSHGLTLEEISAMLLNAHMQGQDDIMKRLVAEAKVEAERLIYTVEQALAKDAKLLTPDEFTTISGALNHLKKALTSYERDTIKKQHQELEQACSSFAEKRMNTAIEKALSGHKIEDMRKAISV